VVGKGTAKEKAAEKTAEEKDHEGEDREGDHKEFSKGLDSTSMGTCHKIPIMISLN
jgi:hypothetical protein